MSIRNIVLSSVSSTALLLGAVPAFAQDTQSTGNAVGSGTAAGADSAVGASTASGAQDAGAPAGQSVAPTTTGPQQEIVVTGIRASLARAAEIKRNAAQVVDSIVAQDIGKFPDPTTASALQRVPGVQVTVGGNNEIQSPIIRGLGDILTTLNGREIFSAEGRTFAFQDLPAEALARVDVYKSNTADLIEGGVAGVIDLKLNRPFDFKDPTIAVNGKLTYAKNADKVSPQVGFLITDRWDTPIGEVGALVNVSWYRTYYNRPVNYVAQRRAGSVFADGLEDAIVPTTVGGLNEYGSYQRPQVNAALQWQATPELQFYAEGLFAGYRSKNTTGFYEYQLIPAESVSDVVLDDNCFTANVDENGNNGGAIQQDLCNLQSATFNNTTSFTSTQAHNNRTNDYLGAIGFNYESGPFTANFDSSYEKSRYTSENFIVDVGKRVDAVNVVTDDNHSGKITVPGNPMNDPEGYAFVNGLNQNYSRADGDLFATKLDTTYEVGSILDKIQVGFRYADRNALYQQAQLGVAPPENALISDYLSQLGDLRLGNFFMEAPGIPQINDGAGFLLPRQSYLLSAAGQRSLRAYFGTGLDQPEYDPTRRFEANEKTYAGYVQAGYKADLGGPITLDGLVGLRVTRTDRTITGTGRVVDEDGNAALVTSTVDTSDTDYLPNASARIQFGGGLQARFTYAKTLARPSFGSLNPGLNYLVSTNPNIINSGSTGNPDLRPQKSDSFDATLEYYFTGGYVSIAGYYRDIKDRVINGVTVEDIDGVDYNISRPRNVGSAKLKGIEVSGQTFFQFLPGALSGFGVFGNFTYADSKVGGEDRLAGFPLQGVSKYNYNAGLLYDKFGIAGRLVYTYRSRYFDEDLSGNPTLRPAGETTWLNYVRPNGRLDFSLGYDVTPNLTLTVEGTNITRAKYRSYWNESYFTRDTRTDDSSYAIGARFKF